MATYTFTSPDGKHHYTLTGPAGATPQQAEAQLQSYLKAQGKDYSAAVPQEESPFPADQPASTRFLEGISEQVGGLPEALQELVSSPDQRKQLAAKEQAEADQYNQHVPSGLARGAGEMVASAGEALPAMGLAGEALPAGAIGLLTRLGLGSLISTAATPTGETTTPNLLKAKGVQLGENVASYAAGEGIGKGISTAGSYVGGKLIPQGVRNIVKMAEDEFGFKYSAGQQNPPGKGQVLKSLEGKMNQEHNQAQFQKYLAKELGSNKPSIDESVLAKGKADAQKAYRTNTHDTPVKFDPDYAQKVSEALKKETSRGDAFATLKRNQVEKTLAAFRELPKKRFMGAEQEGKYGAPGVVPAQIYQDLHEQLQDLAHSAYARGEHNLGRVWSDLSSEMDDTVERNLPEDKKGAWKAARRKYAVWSTVKELDQKGQISSGHGTVDAPAFVAHVRNKFPDVWSSSGEAPKDNAAWQLVRLAKAIDVAPQAFASSMGHRAAEIGGDDTMKLLAKQAPAAFAGSGSKALRALGGGVGKLTAQQDLPQAVAKGLRPVSKTIANNPNAAPNLMRALAAYMSPGTAQKTPEGDQ